MPLEKSKRLEVVVWGMIMKWNGRDDGLSDEDTSIFIKHSMNSVLFETWNFSSLSLTLPVWTSVVETSFVPFS